MNDTLRDMLVAAAIGAVLAIFIVVAWVVYVT